jgi:hypothetical protein
MRGNKGGETSGGAADQLVAALVLGGGRRPGMGYIGPALENFHGSIMSGCQGHWAEIGNGL